MTKGDKQNSIAPETPPIAENSKPSAKDLGIGLVMLAIAVSVLLTCWPKEKMVELNSSHRTPWVDTAQPTEPVIQDYVLNTNSKRFHYPDCYAIRDMSEKNRQLFTGYRAELIDLGYSACGTCRP